ncbi:MAG: SBBP repeat-containing protein [Bacteroidota bacterium]|nr:SBBP repeat-containing protein [Bacteroidota bacterium]
MKNLIITFAIFLSMSVSYQFTYAQITQDWVQRYAGPGNGWDVAYSISVDDSGNVYETGSSKGSGTDFDYATIKYNSAGVEQWVARYNGPGSLDDEARSIAIDGSGYIYVTGFSRGIETSRDYTTIKYNSAGVEQWVVRYNGPGNDDDAAYSLAVDGSGNVYVTGGGADSVSYDYVTIKYNSAGVEQWVTRYNGPGNDYDAANLLTVDGSGNVYVTGYSKGSGTDFDYATIKYNSAGVQQWVARYNGLGNSADYAYSIAVGNSGNVFIAGSSTDSGSFFDYATIKYNSAGVEQWSARYNGPGNIHDEALSIAIDSLDNVYVTGYSYGIGTSTDYATIKYNSAGDSLWVARYNGPANDEDYAFSIAVDNSGNIFVTGSSNGGTTNNDYSTIKYNEAGVQKWVARYNAGFFSSDEARAIAVDNSGNVYVTGGGGYGFGSNRDFVTLKYSQPIAMTLNLTALIEGFYNNVTNKMVKDTVRVYLRNINSPYSIVDSAISVLDSNGHAIFSFPYTLNGLLYYIVINHRNSIETWSSQPVMFTNNQLNYDLTTAANKAYGSNLKLKGSKYCIYGGDVNQDGIIELIDFSLLDNDVYNSVSGYLATDVNGDNIVDLSDFSILDNNSFSFIKLIRP